MQNYKMFSNNDSFGRIIHINNVYQREIVEIAVEKNSISAEI